MLAVDDGLGVSDFLQMAGPDHEDASFECSTTLDGVTGSLCVTAGVLLLSGSAPPVRLTADDIHSWSATPTGGTFSLAVEAKVRHTVVLLAQFQGATIHAMTRSFGPRRVMPA